MSQENNLFFCNHMYKTIELFKLYFYIFFDLWYRKEEGHLTWVSKEGTLLKILQWPIWEKNLKRSAYVYACMSAKLPQSCLNVCDPMDCNLPGSAVHRILQARILEWVAMPSSRGSSWPRGWSCLSCVSCIGRRVLYHWCHLGSHVLLIHFALQQKLTF